MARPELLTGLPIGTLLAVASYSMILLGWGDAAVAAAVSVALFAACAIATGVAMALPWLLSRLGKDPPFGAGPLATVVQDLLSILIYFAAAVVLG